MNLNAKQDRGVARGQGQGSGCGCREGAVIRGVPAARPCFNFDDDGHIAM